jgi:simple sugar transport system ATP-binding protein
LLELRSQGTAILLISEELDELLNLSDRIAVIFKGKILAIMPTRETSKKKLGLLMAGISGEGAA